MSPAREDCLIWKILPIFRSEGLVPLLRFEPASFISWLSLCDSFSVVRSSVIPALVFFKNACFLLLLILYCLERRQFAAAVKKAPY